MSTITLIRGDSKSLLVRVRKADGTPADLDGFTFRLSMKAQESDAEPFHVEIGTITDDGVQFTFQPSFTEDLEVLNYLYDIEMANADRSTVNTLTIGFISVIADVGGPPA